jgi:hypothetical protein
MTIGRIARKVQGLSVQDMYYLHRVCLDSKNYSKRFFWELNPKKHNNENTIAKWLRELTQSPFRL